MPSHSLSVPEPAEPPGSFLFSDDILKEITDEEKKFGRYTAERMPKQKRESVIQLLSEQRPVYEIARLVGVADQSVTAIANHPVYGVEVAQRIGDERAIAARQLQRCRRSQLDRLERHPDLLPAASIPIAVSIFTDKAELLLGHATARVEHTERIDIFADFDAFCDELDEKYGKKTSTGNHLGGGKFPVIELQPAEAAADPTPALESHAPGPPSDVELQVSDARIQANPGHMPPYVTDSQPDPAQHLEVATPPGGGSIAAARPSPSMENDTRNFWPIGSFTNEVQE